MNLLYKHFVLVVLTPLLIAGGLLGATPAAAQWGPDDDQDDASDWGEPSWEQEAPPVEDRHADDPSSTRLPDWADSGSFDEDGAERYDFGAEMHNPPPPPFDDGDISQVPVDGGLGFLILAGAGYAAHKLRRRDDEEVEGDENDVMP